MLLGAMLLPKSNERGGRAVDRTALQDAVALTPTLRPDAGPRDRLQCGARRFRPGPSFRPLTLSTLQPSNVGPLLRMPANASSCRAIPASARESHRPGSAAPPHHHTIFQRVCERVTSPTLTSVPCTRLFLELAPERNSHQSATRMRPTTDQPAFCVTVAAATVVSRC